MMILVIAFLITGQRVFEHLSDKQLLGESMTYTLENLIQDCRTALSNDSSRKGRELVCQAVGKALKDQAFVSEHISFDLAAERNVIYEDTDLGFCICAHVYRDAKNSAPHDHGTTWAIYGQADGHTEMTDWEIVEPATDTAASKVKQVRSYKLEPGDVHLYEVGDVHAPKRDAPTRLLRIEGKDTTKLNRTPIEIVS